MAIRWFTSPESAQSAQPVVFREAAGMLPTKPTKLAFVGFVATQLAILPIGIRQLIELNGAGLSGHRAENADCADSGYIERVPIREPETPVTKFPVNLDFAALRSCSAVAGHIPPGTR